MATDTRHPDFVPALGLPWLTGAYDALTGTFFPEASVKERLLDRAGVGPGMRVLDLGCGTGTLAAMAAKRGATVVGVDADPKMLARAAPKIAGLPVRLVEGYTTEVELDEAPFDRVLSTLFFHHLRTDDKRRTLERARGWLRPGGEVHIADWSRPRTPLMRVAFGAVRCIDGFALTRDVLEDRVGWALREAGFESVEESEPIRTIFGNLSWWRAVAP